MVRVGSTIWLSDALRAFGVAMVVVLANASAVPAQVTTSVGVAGTQRLALLRHSTQARAQPNAASTRLEIVSRLRPITGEQTTLPVIGRAADAHGGVWLDVRLPGRPNGHTGWISANATAPGVAHWQITISLAERTVTVAHDGHFARLFRAVVGRPSAPTPVGDFFVEESVKLSGHDVGAPYALALSARSSVFQEFEGGPGQIALHGTQNIGGVLGTAASHGCVRLDAGAITWLANRIDPGTPVTIVR